MESLICQTTFSYDRKLHPEKVFKRNLLTQGVLPNKNERC